MACETKLPKLVQISLTGIQRMITFEAVSASASINLINCLWSLMESSIEEVKLLQTVTLLMSIGSSGSNTNQTVQGDSAAKALALCFRLHFTKNISTNNAASATVRQLVSLMFERVIKEDAKCIQENQSDVSNSISNEQIDISTETSHKNLEKELKTGSRFPPKSLKASASDAYLLLQDLIQLVNADQPFWLTGLTEMTRTFGLELIELILSQYPAVFFKHEEFSYLLKGKICPLIIKLFSPNIKFKLNNLHQHQQQLINQQQQQQLIQSHLQNLHQFQNNQSNVNHHHHNHQQPLMHINNSGQMLLSAVNSGSIGSNSLSSANPVTMSPADKPFYPISIRLLRILLVLVTKYYSMLVRIDLLLI